MKMNLEQVIPLTEITLKQLINLLNSSENAENWHRLAGRNGENIKSVEISLLSGKGYASAINRILFGFHGTDEQFSTVLKYPTMAIITHVRPDDNEEMRSFCQSVLISFHRSEVHFYTKIAAPYLDNLPFIPQIYAWKNCLLDKNELDGAFLLMEDLSLNGVHNIPEEYGFNKDQVKSLLESMANFHANSLKIQSILVEDLYKMAQNIFSRDNELLINGLLTLPDPDGAYYRCHKIALRNFIESTDPGGNEFDYKIAKQFGFYPLILTHGDLWTNNLLFKKNMAGLASDKVASILDWQCVHPGTGINDIVRMMLADVDPELRKSRQQEWLDFYRTKFLKFVNNLKFQVADNFPLNSQEITAELYRQHFRAELHALMMVETYFSAQNQEAIAEHGKMRLKLRQRILEAFDEIRSDYE